MVTNLPVSIEILIPIIPRNTFTLHAKKIYTKYDKFVSLKKIHTKIIIVKINLEFGDLGFLCYSRKACLDLSGFI